MTFEWPWMLLTLAVLPVLALAYRQQLRARAERRRALADLALVAPGGSGQRGQERRRHVGPALFLGALALLFVALARPEASVEQARREGTVVLAFDVSGSMAATDLAPSRMEAAKSAARGFVQRQPSTIRLAVVAFGTSGLVMQQPTTDRAGVLAAIDRLTPLGGTSLGRGLQTSLTAIVGKAVQLNVQPSQGNGSGNGSGSVEAQGQNIGYHGSAAVILLSDGENTAAPDPIAVAELASTAGVRVYPIGLGSPQGAVLAIDGFRVATALDERLLRQIATTTDGRYYAAADEQALAQVYRSIDLAWTVEAKQIEVTALFAGGAAVLLLLGVGLSLVWFGRVI